MNLEDLLMISAGDFRNGVTFEMDGNVVSIIEFQHVKPGKGAAFVRTKIRNVITGSVTEKTFNPNDKFPTAFVERKDMQYLYNDGDLYYLSLIHIYLFGLTGDLTASLLPKSVTTPIAIAVSEMGGGISPIAVAAVIITGIAGAIFSPLLIRVFHIKNPVEQGVAIGAASHAMGTTKALELGEIQGAMSSISLCISGIITVVFALILYI